MSSTVNIRLARKDEYDLITRGFIEWYFPYESLSAGFRINTPSPGEVKYFTSAPDCGLTLVATLPEENDRIIGFLVNTPGNYKFRNIPEEVGGSERHQAFLGFVEAMERKQIITDKFSDEEIFKLLALAVDPTVRGKDIGYKLFERALQMANDLDYSIARTLCTSKFSTKISERHNMTPIASIEYKQHKDSEGNQVFIPPAEHTHATLFVKVLNN